jgi:RNase P subunit RPR2
MNKPYNCFDCDEVIELWPEHLDEVFPEMNQRPRVVRVKCNGCGKIYQVDIESRKMIPGSLEE